MAGDPSTVAVSVRQYFDAVRLRCMRNGAVVRIHVTSLEEHEEEARVDGRVVPRRDAADRRAMWEVFADGFVGRVACGRRASGVAVPARTAMLGAPTSRRPCSEPVSSFRAPSFRKPKMLRRLIALVALGLVVLTTAQPASAQFGPGAGGQAPYSRGGGKNVAGQFDYYALVLSWSPSYCAGLPRDRYDPQCHRRDGKRYSFVVHGLWPQYDRGYPEFCPIRGRPFVPRPVIDRMLDIMPSDKLVIHQYRKHGTCSGLGVDEYFAKTRALMAKVKVPSRYIDPNGPLLVSRSELVADFLGANPKLKRDMIAVDCGRSGNRLREIRICFDKAGEPRSCGRNEDQGRLCRADRLTLPPVRAAGTSPPRR
jgi:ribonuclease T2